MQVYVNCNNLNSSLSVQVPVDVDRLRVAVLPLVTKVESSTRING